MGGSESTLCEEDFNNLYVKMSGISFEEFIRFLFGLIKPNGELTMSDVRTVIGWTMNADSTFVEIVMNSCFDTSTTDCGDTINTNSFICWLERNFPDIFIDFSRFISKLLSSELPNQLIVRSNFPNETRLKQSAVLNDSLISVLLVSLPYSYKNESVYLHPEDFISSTKAPKSPHEYNYLQSWAFFLSWGEEEYPTKRGKFISMLICSNGCSQSTNQRTNTMYA